MHALLLVPILGGRARAVAGHRDHELRSRARRLLRGDVLARRRAPELPRVLVPTRRSARSVPDRRRCVHPSTATWGDPVAIGDGYAAVLETTCDAEDRSTLARLAADGRVLGQVRLGARHDDDLQAVLAPGPGGSVAVAWVDTARARHRQWLRVAPVRKGRMAAAPGDRRHVAVQLAPGARTADHRAGGRRRRARERGRGVRLPALGASRHRAEARTRAAAGGLRRVAGGRPARPRRVAAWPYRGRVVDLQPRRAQPHAGADLRRAAASPGRPFARRAADGATAGRGRVRRRARRVPGPRARRRRDARC